MRNVKSLALAGALAAAALVPTVTPAAAGPWRHHHHYYYGWNPGPAIVAGTVLGLTIGALAAPPYYYDPYPPAYYVPPPYPVEPRDPHYEWCAATYRSYNGETDTWMDASGVVRRCTGPG